MHTKILFETQPHSADVMYVPAGLVMIQDPWALIWGIALGPHTKRADSPQSSKLIQAGVLMGISVNFCSAMLLLELCCLHNLLIG